jgi:hypothetical protein
LVSQLLSAGCSRDGHIQGMQIGGMLPGQSLGAGFYMKQLNELYVRLEEYLARL